MDIATVKVKTESGREINKVHVFDQRLGVVLCTLKDSHGFAMAKDFPVKDLVAENDKGHRLDVSDVLQKKCNEWIDEEGASHVFA